LRGRVRAAEDNDKKKNEKTGIALITG
jgi:hypothetical protein